jgi:hypothetical protein
MPLWNAEISPAEGTRLFGILFVCLRASFPGVGLPLGVGDPILEVGWGVGVEAVGVAVGAMVGDGTPLTLSTTTLMAGLAITLLDESNPLTDSV